MGRRFETSSRTAQEETERRRHEVVNGTAEERKQLKKANAKTSIVFGSDETKHYETEAMRRQRDYSRQADKGKVYLDSKAMKKSLTATHFTLGDEVKTEYISEAKRIEDPTERMHEFITKPLVQDPRISSCFFGKDQVQYLSTSHEGLAYPSKLAVSEATEMRGHAKALKRALVTSNIHFENNQGYTNFQTTSSKAFEHYDPKTASEARGQSFAANKYDLRRQHFEFGNEPVHYETDSMRSMRCGTITKERIQQMQDDAQAAVDLKSKLLATSVVIGDDIEFLS